MQITLAKLSEIHPYPKNARKIPQSAIDAVAKSIQEFGWQQPIVVDRDGVIIVGHCRLLAAHKLGLAEAPVHRSLIIWAKQALQISRGHYHWQHEPCWYAVRKGHTAHWHGDRKQSTLWQVANLNGNGNRDEKATGHGTQKPVELMRRPILNHTVPGEAVYDPFLGSGTTLVACELTERVCFGIDIDAKYVDVIVTRWQNLTGKEATLGDGPHKGCTFAHAKHGRQLEGQDAILEEVLNGAS